MLLGSTAVDRWGLACAALVEHWDSCAPCRRLGVARYCSAAAPLQADEARAHREYQESRDASVERLEVAS